MALQIRRGLEADRLSITPLAGELLYVTDTKNIYVGDGTTAGGALVTGDVLDDLSPQLGGDLDLNGNDIVGTGSINIDGTITATGNINLGDAAGDNINVSGSINTNLIPKNDSAVDLGSAALRWRNGYFAGLQVDGQIDAVSLNANIVADNSTVAYNSATNTFTGNFDGSFTGSIFSDDSTQLVDGINKTVTASISSTDGTEVLFNGTDGTNARFKGDITALDTTKMVDATNKVINIDVINASTLNGNVVGNLTGNVTGNTVGLHVGDVTGSIFADDSTLLVDGVNARHVINNAISGTFAQWDSTVTGDRTVRVNANSGRSIVQLGYVDETQDLSASNLSYGTLSFGRTDTSGFTPTVLMTGRVNGLYVSSGTDPGGVFPESNYMVLTNQGNFGIGTYLPTKPLDIRGDGIISGTLDAASFRGSLVADDSTILIDAINGSLLTANIDIVGTTGTPSVGAGDLANVNEWLQVTVNGNTRYIPLYA